MINDGINFGVPVKFEVWTNHEGRGGRTQDMQDTQNTQVLRGKSTAKLLELLVGYMVNVCENNCEQPESIKSIQIPKGKNLDICLQHVTIRQDYCVTHICLMFV